LGEGTLGGITLFKENASDLQQLAQLTGDIIEASYHNPVMAVDQEGGAVQRFDHALCPLPSPMALAALNSVDGMHDAIEKITSISSRQLKKIGINMLLAPTLDLQTNAKNPIICTRAYGDDGQQVAAIGKMVAAAIEAEGLVAVAKHFPGHGSTSEDSHLQLACVDKSEASLLASDLVPFAQLSDSLKAILIGHIWLPQLVKSKCPATLSDTVIRGLLQQKLGFKGLIVSDDMIMKAITQDFGLGEACVQAILAGVDLLLVCGTIEESMEAVDAIVEATVAGRISEERLHEAVDKIDALIKTKPAYISADNNDQLAEFAKALDLDQTLSRKVSAQAIAILQGSLDDVLLTGPTATKTIAVVAPDHPRYTMALAADLRLALSDDMTILDIRYPLNPTSDDQSKIAKEICEVREVCERDGLIIYLTYRTPINAGQAGLGRAILAETKSPVIHVAVDSPYDINYLPGFESEKITSLATFDPSCQAISALADVLIGAQTPLGSCPVALGLGSNPGLKDRA
jgi:beta-N-acetylhexosaminidase